MIHRAVRFFVFSMMFTFSFSAISAPESPQVIDGCQGEGCGCTRESKTNKDFSLYAEMNLKSKKLGSYKTGTEAKALKAVTKVLDPGKATVQTVKDSKVALKAGDEVTHVFNLGEGFFKALHNGKWVEFEEDQVQLKSVKNPSYDTWLEVQVGKNHGYTPSFPFMGCLE